MSDTISLSDFFDAVPDERWDELATATLKGRDPERLVKTTRDGIDVRPIYFASDSGARRASARRGPWTISQRYEAPSLALVREAMQTDAERGVESAWIRRDIMGVPIQSAEDLEHITRHFFEAGGDEIVLDAGGDALMPAVALKALEGWKSARVYADPIAHLAVEGELPRSAFEELFEAVRHAENIAVGALSGVSYHAHGATAAQEIAAILASGAEVARRAIEDDDVDAWFDQVTLITATTSQTFESIAKIRALRWVWSKLRAGFHLDPAPSRVHVLTSPVSLTRFDPWTNMLRATAQCFAAAVGGADAITVLPFDSAAGIPDEMGRRVATNVHHVLHEESHLTATSDPAAGTYLIESLTDALARKAWSIFQEIESEGGMVAALENGHFQARIEEVWEEREVGIHHRRPTLVGISDYAPLERGQIERQARQVWEVSWEEGPRPGFEELREEYREGGAWYEFESQEPGWECEASAAVREAADFEDLRERALEHQAITSQAPKVFMANIGPLARHNARAGFTRRYLEALGLIPEGEQGFEAARKVVEEFRESGARAAAICGADADYAEHAEEFARALVEAGARVVIYAGRPDTEAQTSLEAAGVTDFIYMGFDAMRVGLSIFDGMEVAR